MMEEIFRNNRVLYTQQGGMKKIGSLIEETAVEFFKLLNIC
jgi:hypothetical protein